MDVLPKGMTREQLLQLGREALVDMLLTALAGIDELEQQVAQQNELLQKNDWTKRYGFGFELLKVECSIEPDGSVEVTRTVTITAQNEVREIHCTILRMPETSSEGSSVGVLPPRAISLTSGRSVSLRTKYDHDPGNPDTSSALITLAPELRAGHTMIYQLVHPYKTNWPPLSVATEGRFPYDYFCWDVEQHATKRLSLRVYFPRGHVAPLDYGREVRYIGSEGLQYEEQRRLEVCNLTSEGSRYVLSLDIDDPMPGLLYMITWRIPAPKESPGNISPSSAKQVVQKTGIPPAHSKRLLTALPRCGPFRSSEGLKAVFTDARISAWRNRVPEAETIDGRVDALIYYLYDQRDEEGRNALSLFLEVAADRLDPADACKGELESLAKELRDL